MEQLNAFLDFVLVNRDEVKITVRAVVVLISVLVATHVLLRYSRIIVTRNRRYFIGVAYKHK